MTTVVSMPPALPITSPEYDPAIRRAVIVPDFEQFAKHAPSTDTDHSHYDAALRELSKWVDLSTATGNWHGLLILTPHTDSRTLNQDVNFIAMWSEMSRQYNVTLYVTVLQPHTTDQPGMSFSPGTGSNRVAYVTIYPRDYLASTEQVKLEPGRPWMPAVTTAEESAYAEVFEGIFGTLVDPTFYPADPTAIDAWLDSDCVTVLTDPETDGDTACGEIVLLQYDSAFSRVITISSLIKRTYDPAGHLP